MNSCASSYIPRVARGGRAGKDQGPGPKLDLSTAVILRATAGEPARQAPTQSCCPESSLGL